MKRMYSSNKSFINQLNKYKMETENGIVVELYDLALTSRKDDRFGRVVSPVHRTLANLIDIAVKRRTDLNPSTLRIAFDIISDVAQDELSGGATIEYGLVNMGVGVDGIFIGNNAQWDSSKNSLKVYANPKAAIRKRINSSTVRVRGMASSGIAINTLTDVASGEVNTLITPGGGVNLTGSKIKIVGDAGTVGLALHSVDTQEIVQIPANAILINDPSKISFVVPANLLVGDYRLVITTRFSGSTWKIVYSECFTTFVDRY
jgi:hypothetical protein